jgi:hypothetical protein
MDISISINLAPTTAICLAAALCVVIKVIGMHWGKRR